jgi:hypothetical protein
LEKRYLSFTLIAQAQNVERLDIKPISFDEVEDKLRYDREEYVFAKNEKSYFLKDDLEFSGKWIEIPASWVVDRQEGGIDIEPFDRAKDIEVAQDAFLSCLCICMTVKIKPMASRNATTMIDAVLLLFIAIFC